MKSNFFFAFIAPWRLCAKLFVAQSRQEAKDAKEDIEISG
jgi:hypothetical protein